MSDIPSQIGTLYKVLQVPQDHSKEQHRSTDNLRSTWLSVQVKLTAECQMAAC